MAEVEVIKKGGNQVAVKCAFCNGTGKDPFELLSILSTCQVCEGSGKVSITEPFVKCPFCSGNGVHPSRLHTCIVCDGKGVIPAEERRGICPECGGNGKSHSYLNVPCLRCKGKGFIVTEKG
jgi:DnaJ-class molecular chaperone